MDKSLYTKSILIGGLTAGLLSAIPGVQVMNCCCCGIWVILGGLIAAYVFVYHTPVYPRDGDGALVGMGAGAVAGIIAGAVNTIVRLLMPSQIQSEFIDPLLSELPATLADQVRAGMEQQVSLPMLIMGLFFAVVIFSAVGALGGVIGMRLFRPLRMLRPADYGTGGSGGPYSGPYGSPYGAYPPAPPQNYGPPGVNEAPAEPGSTGPSDDEGTGPGGSGSPPWGGPDGS